MLKYKGVAAGVVLFFSTISSVFSNPLLSEVYYDTNGPDNGFEWIELYNPTAAVIDLSVYSLGWGGNDYAQGTGQLSGMLTAGSYFVVGGPGGGVGYDLVLNFSPDIQNAGSIPDAVALLTCWQVILRPPVYQ